MSRVDKEVRELWREHPWLLAFTLTALLFGIYARFKGLGTWPLTADEYYIARSVQNILRTGIPEYDCGGYYARGLLMQYLSAALQLGGLSAELAPRLIAALCSLVALPAVYILGKRVHSSQIGLLAVTVLALSVWEVEIARFGRMYAPFQALFAWYMVYFLKYTMDRDHRALWPMLALSIVGALTWEGAALLALVNFLPPIINHSSGRLSRRDVSYLAGAASLLLLIAWFVTLDVRLTGSEAPFPADYELWLNKRALGALEPTALWTTLTSYPLWSALALIPLGLAFFAVRWIWNFKARWIAAAGLMLALIAATLHQFAAFAAVILLLLMLHLIRWKELIARKALPFHAAVVACVVFWTAFGFLTDEWRVDPEIHWLGNSKAVALAYEFARFPDFLQEIVVPWGRAVPILGLALLGLISVGIIRSIARDAEKPSAERVIQLVLVCMLLAASASDPPRHETRYLYFVYPLAVIVAFSAIAHLVEAVASRKSMATAFTAVAALGVFALTEEFSPRHLLKIDSPEVNFRVDTPGGDEAHLQPRSDPRGAAKWLAANSTDDQDLVINGVPTVDFYFSGFDYTYIDWQHRRFRAYACRQGTVERWGNLPLLYTDRSDAG